MKLIKRIKILITISLLMISSSLYSNIQYQQSDTNKVIQVNIYLNLCQQYQNSNPDTAIYFGNIGLKYAIQFHYINGIGTFYLNIGKAHYNIGDYNQAMEYFLKSIKIFESINFKKGIADVDMNIGYYYFNLYDYTTAQYYYLQSELIYKEINDINGLAILYHRYGLMLHEKSKTNSKLKFKSLIYYNKALEIFFKLNDKDGVATCYNSIAVTNMDNNKFNEAHNYYNKAINISKQLNNKNKLSVYYGLISLCYVKEQNYNKVIEYANKSILLAQEIKAKDKEAWALQYLWMAYKAKGNYKTSLEMYEQCKSLFDQINNEKQQKYIAKLETQYQTEKIKLLINNLEIEKQIQINKNNQQKIIITLIICFMILLITFIIFIINRLRVIINQRQIIEIQKTQVDEINKLLIIQSQDIIEHLVKLNEKIK